MATKRQVLSLFGLLQYACKVIRPGRTAQVSIPQTSIQMLGRWKSNAYQLYIKTPPRELAFFKIHDIKPCTSHYTLSSNCVLLHHQSPYSTASAASQSATICTHMSNHVVLVFICIMCLYIYICDRACENRAYLHITS